MTLTITHPFVSTVAEGPGSGVPGGPVGPNEWNATHSISGTATIANGGTNASSFTTTDVVYYNGTSLVGDSGLTYTTPGQLSIALGSIGANAKALNITGTWNNAGVTFDAPLFMNVTNTASGQQSLVADFQIGGTSTFGFMANAIPVGGSSGGGNNNLTFGPSLYLANGANPTIPANLIIYDNVDNPARPTNFSCFLAGMNSFNFQGTYNIGTYSGGTGTARPLSINSAGVMYFCVGGSGFSSISVGANVSAVNITQGYMFGWGPNNDAVNGPDTQLSRKTAGVISIGQNGVQGSSNGWMQWGGEARLDQDFSATSNTTLANVTGSASTHDLSLTLIAGRKYIFKINLLMVTGASAGGIKIGLGGTATITNLIADGMCIDSTTNIAVTQVTSLTQMIANTNTGTTPKVSIWGEFECNVAGTFTVQFAQNASSGTASTVKRGSYMLAFDAP